MAMRRIRATITFFPFQKAMENATNRAESFLEWIQGMIMRYESGRIPSTKFIQEVMGKLRSGKLGEGQNTDREFQREFQRLERNVGERGVLSMCPMH